MPEPVSAGARSTASIDRNAKTNYNYGSSNNMVPEAYAPIDN